jgi:hypothetical protein
MSPNRRSIVGLLGAGVAGAALVRMAEGQAPLPNADAGVQAARQSLQRDAQRIAMVSLPPSTEPAAHFRA